MEFKKRYEKKENKFHPDLTTEIVWGNGDIQIREINMGGIGPRILYKVYRGGEFLGEFDQDFKRGLREQIREVLEGEI